MPEQPSEPAEKPVLTLLQQLKDGSIHARTLTKEQRQQCVEALLLEGYSTPQIAQIVDRNEKTIKRDLTDIRARNALNPSPELAKQLIGDLFLRTEAHHARLVRLAGSAEGSPGEKAQATFMAFRVLKERTELLQSLGYLPQQPQRVQGEFIHHVDEGQESSLESVEQTILEIESVAKETGTLTPELTAHVQALQRRLEQAKLSQDAQRLLEQQRQVSEGKDSSDAG